MLPRSTGARAGPARTRAAPRSARRAAAAARGWDGFGPRLGWADTGWARPGWAGLSRDGLGCSSHPTGSFNVGVAGRSEASVPTV